MSTPQIVKYVCMCTHTLGVQYEDTYTIQRSQKFLISTSITVLNKHHMSATTIINYFSNIAQKLNMTDIMDNLDWYINIILNIGHQSTLQEPKLVGVMCIVTKHTMRNIAASL